MNCLASAYIKGILTNCDLPDRHAGSHHYGKVADIRLRWERLTPHVDDAAICDDQVNNVVDVLNDELDRDDPLRYSPDQVKRALWRFLEAEIERLQEDLVERFINLDGSRQDRYLGTPEINRREESRIAYGDIRCDEARGT